MRLPGAWCQHCFGLPLLVTAVTAVTVRRWRHVRRRGSPIIAVDSGLAVDWGCWGTHKPPRSPDPPRKCDGSGGCAWCGAEPGAGGTSAPQESPVMRLPGACERGVPVRAAGNCRPGACRTLTCRPAAPPSLLASPRRPVNAEHPAYGVIPGSWGCPEFPLKPDHPR